MSKNTGTSELINYFDLGVNGDVGIAGSLDINTIANATTDTDTFLVSDTGIIKYRTGAQLLSDIGAQAAGSYVTLDTTQTISGEKTFTGFNTNIHGTLVLKSFPALPGLILQSYSPNALQIGATISGTTYYSSIVFPAGSRSWNLPNADGTIALTSQIPANPVGGTGTTNYLPKFTGSTTIGNSNLINDASGNLGLGVTPSAWGDFKVLEFPNGVYVGTYTSGGQTMYLGANNYFDGSNYIYKLSGYATRYQQVSGAHQWHISTISGTAGNVASFTQAMTLTSGGNLLVGTTTDNGAKLQVSASGGYFNVDTNGQIISAQSLDVATAGGRLTGMSSRGALGAIHIEQTTTGANGGYIAFRTSDAGSTTPTEKMRITSGGSVGIGTASPTNPLHIVSNSLSQLNIQAASGNTNAQINLEPTGTGIALIGPANNVDFAFRTNAGERMRITSSGNVVAYQNFIVSKNGNDTIGQGPFVSLQTATGTNYQQNIQLGASGSLDFWNFDSSSWNLRMRIASGGNVLIGTTTDSGQKLQVNGVLRNGGSSTYWYSGADGGGMYIETVGTNTVTRQLRIQGVNDAGTNYSAIKLQAGASVISFETVDIERMRINSLGFLKASNNAVYESASGGYHELIQNNSGATTLLATHRGSDPYGFEVFFKGADPNNASNYLFGAYTTVGGFTWIYRIFSNGTVSARSDARWKKNIETTRNGYIDDLCKLRVVKYNWYNHEDDAPKELGLIAQEVEEVFPNLVQVDPVIAKREVEQEDGTIIEEEYEDGVSRSIKTSVLPFMLLKAMQEQQEQIKELQVQIDKLKNV